MNEEFKYLSVAVKWFWLIVVGALLAAGASYLVRRQQLPTYRTQALVSIGNMITSTSVDNTVLQALRDLAPAYVALSQTDSVLQTVLDKLQLSITLRELRSIIEVARVRDAPLMTVAVTYSDPEVAARIANELAQQLIDRGPKGFTDENQKQLDAAQEQIKAASESRDFAIEQLKTIDEQISQSSDTNELANLAVKRMVYLDQINIATATTQIATAIITEITKRVGGLEFVETASIPSQSTNINPIVVAIAGGVAGVIVTFGLILLAEFSNDTLRSPQQIVKFLQVPVLASIIKFKKTQGAFASLVSFHQPASPAAESYRTLANNLIIDNQYLSRVVIVTSPNAAEGKSTTAANLAVSITALGFKVLLIDANFRQPVVHKLFDIKDNNGLIHLLMTAMPEQLMLEKQTELMGLLKQHIYQFPDMPGLQVLPKGVLDTNQFAQVLKPNALKEWVELILQTRTIDVVIMDTASCLQSSDTMAMAGILKAEIVLVLESGTTRKDAAAKSIDQFAHVGSKVAGIVVNRANAQDLAHGYGYGYYDDKTTMQMKAIDHITGT